VPTLNHIEFAPTLGKVGPYMLYDMIVITHHRVGTQLEGKNVSGLLSLDFKLTSAVLIALRSKLVVAAQVNAT
jgi:hypothetical protein